MSLSGWDHFRVDAGKFEKLECKVCHEEMPVERNVAGGRSWVEAMGGKPTKPHDVFRCKEGDALWHRQALELCRLIEKTPSKAIADLVKAELDQVLKTREVTKRSFNELL